MIKSKKDLRYYLDCDRIALKIPARRLFPRPYIDIIWKYEILLRKTEYYKNVSGIGHRFLYNIYYFKFRKLGIKISISMGVNCFGPGLRIPHYGTIVVNGAAQIGANCTILDGVNIGSTNGSHKAPIIGDDVFIGSGAKVIGDITIADGCSIGAGAVVVNDFLEKDSVIVGIPAKKVKIDTEHSNIIKATKLCESII